MKKLLTVMGLLFLVALVLGMVANAVNPDGVPLVGDYPKIQYGDDSVIIPPSAREGDPPFVTLKEAYGMYNDPGTIFLDAREPEEFAEGHIAGAINLPFDWFDDHWPEVEPQLDPQAVIVVYCSGAECESSLHEARYLKEIGYSNIFIFFGGWSEWASHKFPIEGQGE